MAAVAAMRRAGMAGAAALLGVDGVRGGRRARARVLHANTQVPVLITGAGAATAVERALEELRGLPEISPLALERVRICRRDGEAVAAPHHPPGPGAGWWQKIVVQTGERDARGGQPLHGELVRALRAGGASGATALRTLWGYAGEHEPHGERLFSLRRDVPVRTVICDTPERVRGWWGIVEALTADTGLVTSELIPALRASAPGVVHGGLELAAPRPGGEH
jgi:PII-like signaling protein